jgi:hypothetical protein
MKHGMFILTVIGAFLIMSGCQEEGPVAPKPASNGSQVSPGKAPVSFQPQDRIFENNQRDAEKEQRGLYIRISCTTTSVELAPAPFLKLQITGTGRGTHLGVVIFVSYPTINFTVPPPFPLSGTQVFTAANGDEIFTSFTGSSTPPDPNGKVYITNTHTVTGGTGRFAGATGILAGSAVAHNGSRIGTATLDGTIYVKHREDNGSDDATPLSDRELN